MTMGERLKILMQVKGWSQRQAATVLGTSQTTVNRLIAGTDCARLDQAVLLNEKIAAWERTLTANR